MGSVPARAHGRRLGLERLEGIARVDVVPTDHLAAAVQQLVELVERGADLGWDADDNDDPRVRRSVRRRLVVDYEDLGAGAL